MQCDCTKTVTCLFSHLLRVFFINGLNFLGNLSTPHSYLKFMVHKLVEFVFGMLFSS